MSVEMITSAAARTSRTLRIDFLFLDLTTCTRCRGTGRSLDEALTAVADVLRAASIEVEVNKVQVVSEEQARALRFESSPTIRVDGADIALELRESSCGSEACTDGCGDQIACRVWVHRGQEYTEPPVAMIVDAILRHVYSATEPDPAPPYRVPENLRRFFAGRTASSSSVQLISDSRPSEEATAACCAPAAQQTCCDVSAKQECCGANAAGQSCGCR